MKAVEALLHIINEVIPSGLTAEMGFKNWIYITIEQSELRTMYDTYDGCKRPHANKAYL